MTDTSFPHSSPPVIAHAALPTPLPESFWSILLRRSRYVLAVAVSALIFWLLGWAIGAPPAEMSGVSLLGWGSLTGALLSAGGLLLLLLVVTIICTFLIHPDAPHMGFACALAGMAALSIRGGTSHLLIQNAQLTTGYASLCQTLAAESLLWLIFVAVAEMVARVVHDRYFANTHWITRSAAVLPESAVQPFSVNRGEHRGVSLAVSQAFGTRNLKASIAVPLAIIYVLAAALLLLYITLQSPSKGQVMLACFVSFFLATGNGYLAFPRVPAMAFFLAVPLTALVGYLWASSHTSFIFPGQGSFFVTRALPIDFVTAGMPGAILGYYAAVRWSLHSHE